MGRRKAEPQAQRGAVRTGPPADPTTILARLTLEEWVWFTDAIARLSGVEVELKGWEQVRAVCSEVNKIAGIRNPLAFVHVEPDRLTLLAQEVRKVRTFLDDVIFGHPRPGCAHRETPIPEPRKGGKK